MKILIFSGSVMSLFLSSCGLAGGNYACDLRPKSPQCTDWRDLVGPSATQEAVCKTLAATGEGIWKPNEKCTATDSVGGCQVASPVSKQTNWFYPPRTTDSVKAECKSDGTTFVSP